MALLLFRLVVVWKPDCAEKRWVDTHDWKAPHGHDFSECWHALVGSRGVNRKSSI